MTVTQAYILAVDLGTSGCKTALVNLAGRVQAWAFAPIETRILPEGGAEQNPDDWWQGFVRTTREVMAATAVDAEAILAICLSTQGEGTIPVDTNGKPLCPAILWMDMRGARHVQRNARGTINVAGYGARKLLRWIRLTGGAPALSGKDPAGHMLFVRDEFPEIYRRTHKFLNVLDYMNCRLTGRMLATHDSILTSWVTDNRDSTRLRYDGVLVRMSGIDRDKFPEIVPCTEVIGTLTTAAASELGLAKATKVVAGAIDTTAAAIGSGAIGDCQPHLYIGTSSWIAAHVPRKKTDLFASIASVPCAVPGKYLMIAMQTTAGGNLNFLKDNILYHKDELCREAAQPDVYKVLDRIAGRVPAGSRGLLYAPWLFGERCPVDDLSLRAGLFNLSLEHTREDIARAFLEGVALNTRWMMGSVEKFIGQRVPSLTMIGGGANSPVWRQIFADVLGRPIRALRRPQEANALGAFGIAMVGLGMIRFEQVPAMVELGEEHQPNAEHCRRYDAHFQTFQELYRRLRPLYRRLNTAKPGANHE